MRFGVDDEAEFRACSDALLADYAGWLERQSVGADPDDGWVALDWKWSYAGGDLGTWTVADLDEFLLGWCPRKLSMTPDECPDFPASVGVFCTFLAARGLLSSRSDPPKLLHRHCERLSRAFVREMSDPANFGMAKGLFARAGALKSELTEEDLHLALERMQGMPLEEQNAPLRVGPVRHPDPEQRAESAAAAPVLAQLRRLWEYCAAPGRSLTQVGNLRLADARHLVELLETGDDVDVDHGGYRRHVRPAEDLPGLDLLVTVALDAGVVCHDGGRLVAVAQWADVGPVDALDRLVDAATQRGLAGDDAPEVPDVELVLDLIDDVGPGRLLAELLQWRAAGAAVPVAELEELLGEVPRRAFRSDEPVQEQSVRDRVRQQVQRLAALGVLTLRDDADGQLAELTPAGVPVAVRLAEELGITVLVALDPATASAADVVELVGRVPVEEWRADATAWVQHREKWVAAQQLVAALSDSAESPIVLAVLAELDGLVGEHARAPVEAMLEGPHDGLAVHWLMSAGVLTPEDVGQQRILASGVDTLAVILETGDPDDVVEAFSTGAPAEQLAALEQIWRVDRPGTAPILEVLGAHHPDRAVAKAARKCLLRHRSRVANHR